MNKGEIIQAEKQYVVQTYVRPEVVFTHGKGAYLFDSDGKQYLDFCGGTDIDNCNAANQFGQPFL